VTLRKLWDDIRPNAVYSALMTILLLMWTGVVIVTHGLKWWQQAILVFLAGALFLWAAIATHLISKGSTRKDVFAQGSSQPLTEVPSLRERIFTVCDEMSAYMGERKSRPDEEKVYAQFKDSSTLYAEHYDAEIQSWDDKLNAGYALHFRDKAVNLRHELVLNDVRDGELDRALRELETTTPRKEHIEALKTIIERFRYDASTLH
jgi:hypothetical protein